MFASYFRHSYHLILIIFTGLIFHSPIFTLQFPDLSREDPVIVVKSKTSYFKVVYEVFAAAEKV